MSRFRENGEIENEDHIKQQSLNCKFSARRKRVSKINHLVWSELPKKCYYLQAYDRRAKFVTTKKKHL